MSEGFDAAIKELQDSGELDAVLEIIAERIIAAATLGERDPLRLREAALAWLTCQWRLPHEAVAPSKRACIGCLEVGP